MDENGSKTDLLALVIGLLVMAVCYGGGLALVAGAAGAIGGWFSGTSGVATLLFAAGAALFVRARQKNRQLNEKNTGAIEHE